MHKGIELMELYNTITDFHGNAHFTHISGLGSRYLVLLQTGRSKVLRESDDALLTVSVFCITSGVKNVKIVFRLQG